MKALISHVRRNGVAYLALFVALGGTSYAAATLARNSVGSAQIQKNAVGASEIKRDGVRAPDIRANAVGSDELQAGAVGSDELAAGAITGPVLGYALVEIASDGTGDVDESRSLNVTDDMVRNAGSAPEGFFCFRALPFAPRHIQVTVEHTDAATQFNPGYATAALGTNFEACTIPDEVAIVQTATASKPQGGDRSFFVIFFG